MEIEHSRTFYNINMKSTPEISIVTILQYNSVSVNKTIFLFYLYRQTQYELLRDCLLFFSHKSYIKVPMHANAVHKYFMCNQYARLALFNIPKLV